MILILRRAQKSGWVRHDKTGRMKIDTQEKMALSSQTLTSLQMDALVVVGGDDSNTNAAFLTQEMYHKKVQIIGVPKFKNQTHFYVYDGRGSDPTWFNPAYTYNLGLRVFSLIANGTTGQMAAIPNLEDDFDRWKLMGVPIAPMMHLEERKGRLELGMVLSLIIKVWITLINSKTPSEMTSTP